MSLYLHVDHLFLAGNRSALNQLGEVLPRLQVIMKFYQKILEIIQSFTLKISIVILLIVCHTFRIM